MLNQDQSVRTAVTQSRPPTRESPDEDMQLVVLAGEEAGQCFILGTELVIGRGHGAGLCLSDDEVSRRHARVVRIPSGSFVLEDLGSTNGTRVNGEPASCVVLHLGDRIALGGETVLVFTRQDKLQDKILHMQRVQALGQLAGGVAHDFSNLIGTILASATTLREAPGLPPDVAQGLGEIELAARRAAGVIAQLLAFSRVRPPKPKPSRVAELADECRLLLTHTLPRSIELVINVDPGLEALVDPDLASQVLVNMCVNAGDAMPSGGTISVAAQPVNVTDDRRLRGGRLRPGSYVELSVSDTGNGMDDGTISRIFDPFFTTKPLGRGTGLGLATTRRIVSDHGGAVDVESQPGQGSRFRIYLPTARGQAPALRPEPARTASAPVVSGMVLIVDDEAPVARAAGRVLERIGLSVHIVSSGEEAVRYYQEHGSDIDLVIMDLEMPRMKGDVATEQILRVDREARILVSSGFVDETRHKKLVALGARGVFPKPYDAEGLRQRVIEELLGARAA